MEKYRYLVQVKVTLKAKIVWGLEAIPSTSRMTKTCQYSTEINTPTPRTKLWRYSRVQWKTSLSVENLHRKFNKMLSSWFIYVTWALKIFELMACLNRAHKNGGNHTLTVEVDDADAGVMKVVVTRWAKDNLKSNNEYHLERLYHSHPCPIHRNWVDSSKALDDSTWFARYVSTRFARSRVSQIDFRHDESTTGETIRVDSVESSRIDNIFNPPCIAHRKSRSVK